MPKDNDLGSAMDTLYHRIGGEAVVNRIVVAMYAAVTADVELAPFFQGVEMARQRAKFHGFLNTILGGPAQRSGIELRAAHSGPVDMGLDHSHFDAFCGHLRGALLKEGVAGPLAQEVLEKIEHTRTDVLGL